MLKKNYVLHSGHEQHRAVVARQGSETRVQVDDGEMTQVNHHPVLGGKAISIRHGGRLHLVHLTGLDGRGTVQATINGRPFTLTVMDELKAQALQSIAEVGGSGTIIADIPGLVVEIKVQPGQKVNLGDPVIVVEAMKMQNEFAAAVSGTVSAVRVAVGDPVNPGDTLLEIDPEPGG